MAADEAVWRALAEPTRRHILDLLRERPRTTGELSVAFPVSRYAVMKHLGVLEQAGLVFHRRTGRTRWNHLNAVPIRRIYERWVRGYEGVWAAGLLGLQELVEQRRSEANRMAEQQSGPARQRSAAGLFEIQQEVQIAAARPRVFEALTRDIDKWWRFRMSRTSGSRVLLEPTIGGRFFEQFPDGGGSLWGVVSYVQAPVLLRLTGVLGMVERPVNSIYSYTLEERGANATLVKLEHICIGDLDPRWAESHRSGWGKLLGTDLRRFVEEGIVVDPVHATPENA